MQQSLRWKSAGTWLGLLTALVLVTGGPTFRAIHGILVPHRLCEFHGAVEHVPGGAADLHAEQVRDASSADGLAFAGLVPDAAHSACSFGDLARVEAAPAVSAPVEVAPLHWFLDSVGLVRGVRFPQVALLALAPKHSPPA